MIRTHGPLGAAALACAAAALLLPRPTLATEWLSATGGSGLLDVRSAGGLRHGSVAVEADALTYQLPAGSVPGESATIRLTDGGLQAAVGIGGFSEWWVRGRAIRHDPNVRGESFFPGDGRAGFKLFTRGPGGYGHVGVAVDLGLPFGDRARGGSTDALDPAVTALLTLPLPLAGRAVRARVHLNAGYVAHGDDGGRLFDGFPLEYLEPVYPSGQNDRIDLRAAFDVRSAGTALFAELVLDRLRHPDVAYSESPRFFNVGFRMSLTKSLSVRVATRASLATDDASPTRFRSADFLYPDWQWGVALGWTRRAAAD